MDKKVERFVQKARERVLERGNAAIERFEKCRVEEWDIELRKKIGKIRDLEEIIGRIIKFNMDIDFYAMCYMQCYNCHLKEPLRKIFNAQAKILESISRFDLNAYSLNWLAILLEYFGNIALLTRYFHGIMPDENQMLLFKKLFPVLWKKEKEEEEEEDGEGEEDGEDEEDGIDFREFYRDYYLSMEMMFDFINKDYDAVIRKFDKSGADLLKFENASRTVMKLCMYLSKICKNVKDEETLFGADTMMGIIQLQHYSWLVNVEKSVNIDIPMVMLCTYLHGDIRGLSDEEMHKSMQPEQVMMNLERLRAQSGGAV
jgi:hypothetical protein